MFADTPLDASLTTNIPFDIRGGSDIIANGYHLRIHSSDCPCEGEGFFYSPFGFIESVIGPSQRIRGEYVGRADAKLVSVGSMIFVPPGERLRCLFTPGTRRTVSCLFDINGLGIFDHDHWNWNAVDPEAAFNIRNPFIQVAMQRLAQEAASPEHGDKIHIEYALLFLAAEIKRHFDPHYSSREFDAGKLSAQQLRILSEILEDEDGALPSLLELAARLYLSGAALSARYRNTTGKTLRTYMAEARLHRAKRLLLEKDLLLMKQIAHRSGFGSTAAFSVAFRKATGMTPKEFRDGVK
jgi:AraC family transcriptional regulator